MTIIQAVHDAVVLSTTPKRIRAQNAQMIGRLYQNQEAAANIFIRSGGSGHARSYLKLMPYGDYPENILPAQSELWAYSDVDGAILTLIEKFEQ